MAKGMSLHLGLNDVSPKHYDGGLPILVGCERDAKGMERIALDNKFTSKKLLGPEATRSNVQKYIKDASNTLKNGDIFLLSFSGHGGRLPDLNGDEPDKKDETWCLFDAQIIDDEIMNLFGNFAKGVRILVFADSCHSGSSTKAVF